MIAGAFGLRRKTVNPRDNPTLFSERWDSKRMSKKWTAIDVFHGTSMKMLTLDHFPNFLFQPVIEKTFFNQPYFGNDLKDMLIKNSAPAVPDEGIERCRPTHQNVAIVDNVAV